MIDAWHAQFHILTIQYKMSKSGTCKQYRIFSVSKNYFLDGLGSRTLLIKHKWFQLFVWFKMFRGLLPRNGMLYPWLLVKRARPGKNSLLLQIGQMMCDLSYALNVKHQQTWALWTSNDPEKPKHYLIIDHVPANFNFLEATICIDIPINGVYVHDHGFVCLSYC